jgi:hypothetical protein
VRAPTGGSDVSPVQFPPVTSPEPIRYKGEPLEPERGPGLGCFRFQLIVLAGAIILTPLSVVWGWPDWLSAGLLLFVIVLLLVAGQTIIFLLRLVAADRRSRRRPLGSATKTVGELEDDAAAGDSSVGDAPPDAPPAERDEAADPGPDEPSDGRGPVQQ